MTPVPLTHFLSTELGLLTWAMSMLCGVLQSQPLPHIFSAVKKKYPFARSCLLADVVGCIKVWNIWSQTCLFKILDSLQISASSEPNSSLNFITEHWCQCLWNQRRGKDCFYSERHKAMNSWMDSPVYPPFCLLCDLRFNSLHLC